jgi:SDR family mycofactocin-dependent oxidoreductase
MAGRVAGKVAFITGAARGQIDSVPYAMSTPDDLAETVKEVEALDRRIVATQADVRDYGALKAALDEGVTQLGKLDIVSANAGIFSFGTMEELDEKHWQDMIDVNLTGVWHAAKAAIPHLRANGGGSMILTSSTAGLQALPNTGHYNAAKHGVVGLMRTLALELAPDMIRVNSVHPTAVDTDMIQNSATYELFAPDLAPAERTREVLSERFATLNVLPIPWVEPIDISNAVLWLASDEARYVTGVTLPVDAGLLTK